MGDVSPAQEQLMVRRGIYLVGGFVFTAGNFSQYISKQIVEPYGRQHVVDAYGAGLHLLLGRVGVNVENTCFPPNKLARCQFNVFFLFCLAMQST